MNAVIYYSNTGQSKLIASYFQKELGYNMFELCKVTEKRLESAVLVFPVYCQNIPAVVKSFLKNTSIKYLTVIAAYGKMCYGNVIYDVWKNYNKNLVAAAYVPTKHSYLEEEPFNKYEGLEPVLAKIKSGGYIAVPKTYKNVFADFFPNLRSRVGVKIKKNSNCNNCGVCERSCDYNALKNGKRSLKCIRCLKCVNICPKNALSFKCRFPLKQYLKKKKIDKLIVYI